MRADCGSSRCHLAEDKEDRWRWVNMGSCNHYGVELAEVWSAVSGLEI